jgi:hypothetical protein
LSAQVVLPSLSIQAAMSGLALDVKTVSVSGTITMNGGAPQVSCYAAGHSIAKVIFEETTLGYRIELLGRCSTSGSTAPITFSGTVYPGTYKISVIGYEDYSSYSQTLIPKQTAQVVVVQLTIP